MRPRPAAIACLATSVALLTGCVAPAGTSSAYEQKAVMSAEAAVSAARTAVLAARAHADDRMSGRYLEPVLVDAEDTLGSIDSTFASIQPPPTGDADAVRAKLDPLLQDAASAATEMRIAARQDDDAAVAAASQDLARSADELDAFAQEHGP